MPKRNSHKFSDLVPFMLVLGIFCAISVYLLTSFFLTIRGEMILASVLVAKAPITSEANTYADGYIFKDVKSTHPNATAILYFRDTKVIGGYKDGTFKPDNEVNRAEYLKMLIAALGGIDGDYGNCFTDVQNEWFAPYVCYAKDEGWVKGYSDGSYKPGNSVNKAEAAKITLEAFGYDVSDAAVKSAPFKDVPVGQWFTPYVYMASENNLLEVASGSEYHPGDPMTRAATVELIYRAMNDMGMVKPTI
ncbi:MAG: S-layer homology domain-containing protein [Patescibacteria group bacterium]|nr:S-layer homology domain-containing protein [Patescibacteria group bacterium]